MSDLDLQRKRRFSYQRHYSKWHPDTPEHRADMKKYYKGLLETYIKNIEKKGVLDIGCGMGFALEYFQDEGFASVVGIDADAGQVDICKKNGLKVIHGNNLKKIASDIGEEIVLITAFDFLEHLSSADALELLEDVYAILPKGGTFLCTVPNANSVMASRFRYIDFTHLTSYTEHSLDFLLFHAGFKNISIYPAGNRKRPSIKYDELKYWIRWGLFLLVRKLRRIEAVVELGEEGKDIPLSLNILGMAVK